ncbi:MAG TPA: HD domain-containing protein [Frankiaceae bacterium]|nr:HD domain-containing protein [Frankiaceae bacterium]
MRLADRTLPDALFASYRPVLVAGYGTPVGCHDIGHALRVARWANRLSGEAGADARLCVLAALFHDIGYDSGPGRADHELRSAAAVRVALRDLPDADVATVAEAVASRRFSKLTEPKSPVGMVLDDADNLDALGYVGVARAFLWLGEHRPDPDGPPRDAVADGLAKHVEEKLGRLADLMHTDAAREIAVRRTATVTAFVEGLREETGDDAG